MKKFYTVMLGMLAISISASAADFSIKAVKSGSVLKNSKVESAVAKKVESNNVARVKKAQQAAPAVEDIIGEYEWNFYSYLVSNTNEEFSKANITIDMTEAGDSLAISFQGWDVKGVYNAETGVISIPSYQFLEYNVQNGIDVYFYHNRWNDNGKGNNFLKTPLEMTVSGDEIFVDDLDNIVIGLEGVGYFYFAGSNTIEKKVPLDMFEGWEEVGTGTFYDGWILSRYSLTLEEVIENELGVEDVIVEYNADKGLYRLNNPYQVGGSVFDEDGLNIAEEPGYIVFDMSSPDFVYLYPEIYSGFTSEDEMDFYNFNLEGLLVAGLGYTPEIVLNNLDVFEIENVSKLDVETGTLTIYNCMFGTQDDPMAGYGWQTQEGQAVPMVSQFVCEAFKNTSVKNLDASEVNAPIEFFNLQGQKVANPEKGLYIVRKGGEAKKILVK